jgi:hypothetical protein
VFVSGALVGLLDLLRVTLDVSSSLGLELGAAAPPVIAKENIKRKVKKYKANERLESKDVVKERRSILAAR